MSPYVSTTYEKSMHPIKGAMGLISSGNIKCWCMKWYCREWTESVADQIKYIDHIVYID